MIAFIGGFVACGIIAFVIYFICCYGITQCIKDNELTVAVYKNETDTWEIPRNFEHIAQIIEGRRKFGKPGSIKYID